MFTFILPMRHVIKRVILNVFEALVVIIFAGAGANFSKHVNIITSYF